MNILVNAQIPFKKLKVKNKKLKGLGKVLKGNYLAYMRT